MRTIGIGIQDYEKLITNDLFYVDKTDFIRQWYKKMDDVTLITRPRRFGKTLTLHMLNCFFSVSYHNRSDLFRNLNISKEEEMMKLQGTVPTIFLSLASVKPGSFPMFLMALSECIANLYSNYDFLLKDDFLSQDDRELFREMRKKSKVLPSPETEMSAYLQYLSNLNHSLLWLSGWLEAYYGKKVFIFLDEYDTPIQAAWLNHYYNDAIEVMRNLFAPAFKTNPHLDRALLTGITRIAKESLFSDMNNIAVYSLVGGGYDNAFGFTKNETDAILKEYGLEDRKEELRFWYDGFVIGKQDEIYNPWSVTNYLSERPSVPKDYWAKSGGMGLVDSLVRNGSAQMHENLQKLLQGEKVSADISEELIFPDLDEDDNAVWTLLISAGYIKPFIHGSMKPGLYEITNYETKQSLIEMGKRWFRHRSSDFMSEFAKALLSDNLSEMNRQMQEIVLIAVSSFDSGIRPSRSDIHPENYFHGLSTGLVMCLMRDYHITSNRESGHGRYDLCLEPLNKEKNKAAYLLEFKVFSKEEGDKTLEDTAARARNQIDEKNYDADLLSKGFSDKNIHKYGLGFRGKEVLIV